MVKDKFNEATVVASSRSRGGNKTLLKPKEDRDAGAFSDNDLINIANVLSEKQIDYLKRLKKS